MGERNTSGSFEARDGRYGELPREPYLPWSAWAGDDCPEYQGPDICPLCGHDVDGVDGVYRTVDLDPGDPEVGPDPDIQECLVHVTCPPGPKAWEDELTASRRMTGDLSFENEE